MTELTSPPPEHLLSLESLIRQVAARYPHWTEPEVRAHATDLWGRHQTAKFQT
jgi:hypothetical protein